MCVVEGRVLRGGGASESFSGGAVSPSLPPSPSPNPLFSPFLRLWLFLQTCFSLGIHLLMPFVDRTVVEIIKVYLDSQGAAAFERGSRVRGELEARAQEYGPELEEVIEHSQDDWSHEENVWESTSRAWTAANTCTAL